jgi:hypothetical protein
MEDGSEYPNNRLNKIQRIKDRISNALKLKA